MNELSDALHEFFLTGSVSGRLRFEMGLALGPMDAITFGEWNASMEATGIIDAPGVLMFTIQDIFHMPKYRQKTREERQQERWIREASTLALQEAGFKIDTIKNS